MATARIWKPRSDVETNRLDPKRMTRLYAAQGRLMAGSAQEPKSFGKSERTKAARRKTEREKER